MAELLPEVEGMLDDLFWSSKSNNNDDEEIDRKRQTLLRLQRAAASEQCAEEIRRHMGIERLRKVVMLSAHNEELVNLAAGILASCSGSTAAQVWVHSTCTVISWRVSTLVSKSRDVGPLPGASLTSWAAAKLSAETTLTLSMSGSA